MLYLGLCVLKSGTPQHHYSSLFFCIFVLHKVNSIEYLKGGTTVPILQGYCQEGICVAEL